MALLGCGPKTGGKPANLPHPSVMGMYGEEHTFPVVLRSQLPKQGDAAALHALEPGSRGGRVVKAVADACATVGHRFLPRGQVEEGEQGYVDAVSGKPVTVWSVVCNGGKKDRLVFRVEARQSPHAPPTTSEVTLAANHDTPGWRVAGTKRLAPLQATK